MANDVIVRLPDASARGDAPMYWVSGRESHTHSVSRNGHSIAAILIECSIAALQSFTQVYRSVLRRRDDSRSYDASALPFFVSHPGCGMNNCQVCFISTFAPELMMRDLLGGGGGKDEVTKAARETAVCCNGSWGTVRRRLLNCVVHTADLVFRKGQAAPKAATPGTRPFGLNYLGLGGGNTQRLKVTRRSKSCLDHVKSGHHQQADKVFRDGVPDAEDTGEGGGGAKTANWAALHQLNPTKNSQEASLLGPPEGKGKGLAGLGQRKPSGTACCILRHAGPMGGQKGLAITHTYTYSRMQNHFGNDASDHATAGLRILRSVTLQATIPGCWPLAASRRQHHHQHHPPSCSPPQQVCAKPSNGGQSVSQSINPAQPLTLLSATHHPLRESCVCVSRGSGPITTPQKTSSNLVSYGHTQF
ncbi:hypothetical protein IF1G_07493 [Cordyceps javanica]|uniref:Uncharacterized protein n=1 Tax=Cordyceps javanica TaxID=43265 RepID=A0A545UWE1_9HYPO|nr:hypothetical protein IF1G_07493 [Cordyceps javanica]